MDIIENILGRFRRVPVKKSLETPLKVSEVWTYDFFERIFIRSYKKS